MSSSGPRRPGAIRGGPQGPYGLGAALWIDTDYVPVRLLNVAFGLLELGARSAFGLKPGDRCTVALVPGDGEAVTATAWIRDTTSWSGGARLVLQLVDAEAVHSALPQRSQLAFNRRGAFRVVPESRSPILAQLSHTETSLELSASVISVSVTGLGVLLPAQAASRVVVGDIYRVSFDSPLDGAHLRLVAEVRYVTPSPVGARVGLAFVTSGSAHFAKQQKHIARYVMELQRRLLRIASD